MLLFNAWTAFSVVLIINFLFLGVSVFVIYKAINFLIKGIQKVFNSIGVGYLQGILGLGATILIFSQMLTLIVSNVGKFLTNNFSFISQNLSNPIFIEKDAGLRADSISKLSSAWTDEVYRSFQSYILTIPIEKVLLFLICWILFSFLIKELFTMDSKSHTVTGLKNFFQTTQWRYIVFATLIFFSTYLSIAAIIAVPVFQEHASSQGKDLGMNISTELEQFQVDRASFYKQYEIIPDSNMRIADVSFNQTILDKWSNLVESTYERISQNQFEVETNFKITENQKISKEDKLDYMESLIDWLIANKSAMIRNLNSLKPVVQSSLQVLPKLMPIDSVDSTSTSYDKYDATMAYSQASLTILSKLKLPINDLNKMPDEPEIGERFGFFGLIAGWLLKTNLLPLALITGMFGFGLFGATISNVVREDLKKDETPKGLMSTDFIILLIRGFSAAIVIFLAVMGGLAVFGSTEGTVNPYILFFTCFVAAVFSEDIWTWARSKMNSTLDTNK